MTEKFLLPGGEIATSVRLLEKQIAFSTFDKVAAADDLSKVEFYVPPYLGGPPTVEILKRLPNVQVVQALTAGIDWIEGSIAPNVTLCNARGVHEASTSELALTGVLALTKQIVTFANAQREQVWAHRRVGGLHGSRAVIIGFGAIGAAVAHRLKPFGVSIIGVTGSGRNGTITLDSARAAIQQADILIVTAPLTSATHRLVDADLLGLLPDGAMVLNVGRGAVVDTNALLAELRTGRLRAFLDVTDPEPLPSDHELWSLPNIIITPHVGGNSELFPRLASQLVAAQMRRYHEGQPLENAVRLAGNEKPQ